MSKEKQIEEMSNEIYETLMLEAECPLSGMDCAIIADLLVSKGYRKASEVANEMLEELANIRMQYASGDIDGDALYIELYTLEKKYKERKWNITNNG